MKDTLIFEWQGRHHLHPMLPVTIVLAAILHAGLFFAFSILHPRPENAGPNPAQIYFVPPGSPDAVRMQGLLRTSDPAVFAPGLGLDLPDPFPPVAYVPRYVSDKPALDPLPAAAKSDIPRSAPAGPVPVWSGNLKPPEAGPAPAPTKLVASGALSGRVPPLPEETMFVVPAGFDPEPAVFLICVQENGQVANIFLQRGSGDPALDAKATNLLRWNKFSPAQSGTEWGFVTFQWGRDVQSRPPQ